AGEFFAKRVDRTTQCALDALGDAGVIGLTVKRRKNGAAHQGCAADARQNRAGKPLHRDATTIDDAAGAAVDRKRRLVAEIDALGVGSRSGLGGRADRGALALPAL